MSEPMSEHIPMYTSMWVWPYRGATWTTKTLTADTTITAYNTKPGRREGRIRARKGWKVGYGIWMVGTWDCALKINPKN